MCMQTAVADTLQKPFSSLGQIRTVNAYGDIGLCSGSLISMCALWSHLVAVRRCLSE